MDYLLSLNSVDKFYGSEMALDGVSLGFMSGRTVGILGPERAGKTSLCNIICGFEKPDEGKVYFGGKRIKPKTKALISYLPQKSFLRGFKTIRELLDFYRKWRAEPWSLCVFSA